jgi:hypothetical protein
MARKKRDAYTLCLNQKQMNKMFSLVSAAEEKGSISTRQADEMRALLNSSTCSREEFIPKFSSILQKGR